MSLWKLWSKFMEFTTIKTTTLKNILKEETKKLRKTDLEYAVRLDKAYRIWKNIKAQLITQNLMRKI